MTSTEAAAAPLSDADADAATTSLTDADACETDEQLRKHGVVGNSRLIVRATATERAQVGADAPSEHGPAR